MYLLYFNEDGRDLQLRKAPKHMQDLPYENEVSQYNDNLYICLEREPLKELASSLKQEWIKELEDQLEKLKAHKI